MNAPNRFASLRRLRHPRAVPRRIRKWTPRLTPRDKYDVRLMLAVYGLFVLVACPVIWTGLLLPVILARLLGLGFEVGIAAMLALAVFGLWASARAIASHVETSDDGLRVVGLRSRTIAWDEIESVEPLNRWDTVRTLFRWPFRDWNLQMSCGLTLGGYVRIKTAKGSILFGPENRARFLEEMHMHLYRAQAPVQIPIWQWHTVTPETSEACAEVQQISQ